MLSQVLRTAISSLRPFAALALAATAAACGGSPESQATSTSGGGAGGATSSSGSGGAATSGSSSGGTGGATSSSTSSGGTGGNGAGGSAPITPGITFLTAVTGFPADVTPDGHTVLLNDINTGDIYFYDATTSTLQQKTTVTQPDLGEGALGISATLRVIGSAGSPGIQAGIWSEGAGWTNLPNMYPTGCDAFNADGYDLTADGKVGVGMVWNGCHTEAFRWTDTGGAGSMQILDTLGTPQIAGHVPSNRATKVSDDGTMMGGFAMNNPNSRVPAAWRPDGSGFLLDPANMGQGEVLAISADGSVLAGYLANEAFTWTEGGGLVMLPRLQDAAATEVGYVNAVVAGGKLVFGRFSDPGSPGSGTAFVWTPDAQTRSLFDVVFDAGIDIPSEYTLWNVTAASTDGTVVVGTALSTTNVFVPWVLTMPVSAYGL